MSRSTAQQVVEERNRRLIIWVADQHDLKGGEREQVISKMTSLFKHASDNELAAFVCGMTLPMAQVVDEGGIIITIVIMARQFNSV